MTGRVDAEEIVARCAAAARDAYPEAAVAEELARMLRGARHLLDGLNRTEGGVTLWHESDYLTILVMATPPGFRFWPHNHAMWAATGMLFGTEHNEVYSLDDDTLRTRSAFRIDEGDARAHPADVIHTAGNPGLGLSWGIHVFGGNPATASMTEWDPVTGAARTVDAETVGRRRAALEEYVQTAGDVVGRS